MMGVEVNGQAVTAEKGKGIYQRLCACCHGTAGKGDGYGFFDPLPADLKAPATQKETDEELLDTIRNGHPNTAMGTWKYALWEVILPKGSWEFTEHVLTQDPQYPIELLWKTGDHRFSSPANLQTFLDVASQIQ